MRERIIETIKKEKIVSILRGIPADKLIKTIEAIHKGGISCVEVTLNHTSPENLKASLDAISLASAHFGKDAMIGAGTVITAEDVELAAKAGAKFIVSPNTNREAIVRTRELGLVSLPGAYTPTEICNAYAYGADFVKVFPLEASTAVKYVKALKGPLAHIPLVAVSGVSVDNLEDVIKAGACGVGIGQNIAGAFVKDFTSDADFEKITANAKAFRDILAKF